MKPIAFVESCFRDKFGTPRQPGLVPGSRGWIVFEPEVQPELSLMGLEGFSHLWIIFLFHQNKTARYHAKVHPPRLEGKTMGLFATRTPHRPNPIGLSLVSILEVQKDRILVAGLDLVDGTPVIDVKPYLPEIESIPDAQSGWQGKIQKKPIQIEFEPEAEVVLGRSRSGHSSGEIKELIVQTLQLDPRPVVYRGFEGESSPYRSQHAVRLYDLDIHFRFISDEQVLVFEIRLES